MNTNNTPPKKPLKDALFERIESEHVCPRSRLFFQSRECVVWFVWFFSIVVGALAVAVSLFVVTHRQYELYEATHENFFTFIVEVLPYVWFFVFGLMAYLAVYNLRHTKHGYRYPVSIILLSSVILSFAGGSALQMFGLGYTFDNVLGQQMPMYTSQGKLEQRLWQMPSDGRLLGRQVLATVTPTTTIIFEDMNGQRWRMDVTELTAHDIELLASEQKVRLLGQTKNAELHFFHACGAFPWMIDRDVTMHDMDMERRAFIERVYKHAKRAEDRLALLEGETFASTSLAKESVCANIAAVRRMPINKAVD
jgi:hypothetical protein